MSANSNKSEAGGAGTGSGATERTADDVRRSFSALPLDQKFLTLIRVELDMVGDAVDAVASAASKVLDEVADAFTEHSKPDASGSAGQPSTS
jgi:hypothetical protein